MIELMAGEVTSSDRKQQYWQRLKALFPSHQLDADLKARGLSPTGAAIRVGLQPSVVLPWVQGTAVPRASSLRKFLSELGVDLSPYQEFLDHADPMVLLVCPSCGRTRPMKKGLLPFAGRRVADRFELPRRADGRYERLCRACSSRGVGRQALRLVNKRALEHHLPKGDTWVLEDDPKGTERNVATERSKILAKARTAAMGGAVTLADNRDQFRQMVKRPRGAEHRAAIARGHIIHAVLTRPFFHCRLCGLLVYGHPWHKPCALRALYWKRRNHADELRPDFGRPASPHTARNYQWLIRRRAGVSRRDALKSATHPLGPYGPRQRYRRRQPSKSTVTKAIASFVRLLPGSWNLVFSVGGHKKHQQGNDILQELIPLPLELHSLLEAGHRDELVWRLHSFGMPPEEISQVTGADGLRISRIIVNLSEPERH